MAEWREGITSQVRGECVADASLAARTSIRIGGPADLLVCPQDPDDLAKLLKICSARSIPLLVIGGGANLLVSDAGIRGVVVRLPARFGVEERSGKRIALSAGAANSRLVARARSLGLVGCEFIAGIPGTLGGAVVMNAGTRSGEMKEIVSRVEISTAQGAGWVEAASLAFSYRTAHLPPGGVVTRVEVTLRDGDPIASARAIRADLERRRQTQPLGQPTFGSTFCNPPGDSAGRLIEAVGLKGHRIGGAAWSDVHANFVVNLGGATSADVLALIRLAKKRVQESFGVLLESEVRLVGEFSGSERS